jgi:hypothetical protein
MILYHSPFMIYNVKKFFNTPTFMAYSTKFLIDGTERKIINSNENVNFAYMLHICQVSRFRCESHASRCITCSSSDELFGPFFGRVVCFKRSLIFAIHSNFRI